MNDIFQIFDKIYILNLSSSINRKKHMIQEFKRIELKRLSFFQAIDCDSEKVHKLREDNMVLPFPPCFRCNKIDCNHESNFISNKHLGNWCSYYEICQDIIHNKYSFCIIFEDDIKFNFNYYQIFEKLLNKKTFKKYKINFNKPVLLRMGYKYNKQYFGKFEPIFTKERLCCNPCFAINNKFAQLFIDNFIYINQTSDGYIHNFLPNTFDVQDFTMYPFPIYELSYKTRYLNPEFKSTINTNKLYYKELLFFGHPRCGGKFLHTIINNVNLKIGLNKMNQDGIILEMNHTNYINNYLFNKKIYFIKHPLNCINGVIKENNNEQSYNYRKKKIQDNSNIILPSFIKIKTKIQKIEIAIQCLYFWDILCLNLNPDIIIRVDLDRNKLITFLNLKSININQKIKKIQHIEKQINSDIYQHLIDLCNKYNYQIK